MTEFKLNLKENTIDTRVVGDEWRFIDTISRDARGMQLVAASRVISLACGEHMLGVRHPAENLAFQL